MKQLLVTVALIISIISCKKETSNTAVQSSILDKIKLQLKDSLSAADFQQLDLGNSVSTSIPNSGMRFLRVPFLRKSIETDFVLLKIEIDGFFSAGNIFDISKDLQLIQSKRTAVFNGNIKIFSLRRKLLTASTITNGYVDAFSVNQNNAGARDEAVEIPLMPEVVVMCYLPTGGGGWDYSDYYDLASLFSGGGGGGTGDGGNSGGPGVGNNGQVAGGTGTATGSGYYSNSNPYGVGTGYAGNNKGGGSGIPKEDNPIRIDHEYVDNLHPINVGQYLKCFGNIPDNGATCTVKILTDIPNDKDPGEFLIRNTLQVILFFSLQKQMELRLCNRILAFILSQAINPFLQPPLLKVNLWIMQIMNLMLLYQ